MRFSGTGSRNSETLSNQLLQPWPESDHKAQHWGLAGCSGKCTLSFPSLQPRVCSVYEATAQPYFSYNIWLNLDDERTVILFQLHTVPQVEQTLLMENFLFDLGKK